MRNILIFLGVCIFIGLAIMVGCGQNYGSSYSTTSTTATTVPAGPTASVSIGASAFTPSNLTITAETTVIWTDNDTTTTYGYHTVTSTSGPASLSSGVLANGGSYSRKFTSAEVGTTTYKDTYNSFTAEVVVHL